METIAERLKSAYNTIKQSALAAHRPPNTVKLLAVSKTKPVSDIVQAYDAGQRLFGENYVQEGVEKIHALQQHSDIEWHFIGPLQSNKTRLVAENFAWVHSIDRVKIAQRLNDQRNAFVPLNVCLQVNIDEEQSKSGVTAAEVFALAEQVAALPRLRLRGLMTIPSAASSEAELADSFQRMHHLYTQLASQFPQVDTLSMGMSDDMALAIRYGSTMVRIGSAIFGARQ